MAKLSQRFFAIFFAVLFLVTSSFVAIAFIIANVQSKDNSKNSKTASSSQQSMTNNTNPSTTTTTSYPNSGQLPGFTPTSDVSELKTTDTTVGTGATVQPGDTVKVSYSGAVASTGTIFQTSNTPISLSLSQVIEGWQKGIPGMKVGGSRQILIPANMAYGANPPSGSGIPANAPLVFDVTVASTSSK